MRIENLIALSAPQQQSFLMQAIAAKHQMTPEEVADLRIDASKIHFHDASTNGIAWNNVQAIRMYNEHSGENLDVPTVATEGYNQHGHTSDMDGGYIPGAGPHDHRDNFNGGFAFAVFHPGTSLPQQPWGR